MWRGERLVGAMKINGEEGGKDVHLQKEDACHLLGLAAFAGVYSA